MDKDKFTLQSIRQDLIDNNLQAKAIIQDIVNSRTTIAELEELNEAGRAKLSAIRKNIERLDDWARDMADTSLAKEVDTHRDQFSKTLQAFRKANVATMLEIEKANREELMAITGESELRQRTTARARHNQGSLVSQENDVTEKMLAISRHLSETTQKSAVTLETLVASSQNVEATSDELQHTAGSIKMSGKLLKKKQKMSTTTEVPVKPPAKSANYFALQTAFENALEKAIEESSVEMLVKEYNSYTANSEHDKRLPMDHAFRVLLMKRLNNDVKQIGDLVRLSVEATRSEIVSNTIPVVLLIDTFDVVTLDRCQEIFKFVEELVDVWKEEIFFASCKNNILRMCNDLLRRLSRTQNTVFCGRILLFLSKFFPFSERSGLNIVSEFNLDNLTEYGLDSKDHDDTDNKELEDTAEDIPLKIDYDLYCKFWSLQDFFRNPNQCYGKAQWKMFHMHAENILQSFASFKLEDVRPSSNGNGSEADQAMDVDDAVVDAAVASTVSKANHFFAKFLTNPKLLALQLSDSNFRRAVLVQFLILFQYLQVSVKFKTDAYTLTAEQADFIKDTEIRVRKLLEETPPYGKRFSRTVCHMLQREEMWNNWKNEGCKEFKKPEDLPSNEEENKPPPAKRPKRPLGDSLRDAARNGKFFLGNENLTRLWNYSPDNLQACKSEQRNFLPLLETYLESPHDKIDPAFEWRALRLLARQTPHFFTSPSQPSSKISDYLEQVRKRLIRDREPKPTTTVSSNASEQNNGLAAKSTPAESEQEAAMALQEAEPEQDLEVEDTDPVVEEVEEDPGHEKSLMVTAKHIDEVAPLIGEPWMKVGKKIGFSNDELLFYQMEHPTASVACSKMLCTWISEDDDATLENWAYMLEGLEMNQAADAVKAIIEREKSSGSSASTVTVGQPQLEDDNDVEVLSD